MIRNYNGNVNRTLLRGLHKLCMVNSQDEKNLFEAFNQNGDVSFYENTDFLGLPDEMSNLITLTTESEISDYLKKHFSKKMDLFLQGKKTESDYLLTAVISFIKEKGYFPIDEEMRKLECEAENKRLIDFPVDLTAPTRSSKEDLLKELVELSEEIFERRRLNNPKDIRTHVEPYYDELYLTSDNFCITISWDRYYGQGDNSDYKLHVNMNNDDNIHSASFQSYGSEMYITAKNWCGTKIDLPLEHLITIHKKICELAEQEGIVFLTEIDYENLKETT